MTIEVNELSKWYGQIIGVNRLNFKLLPGVTGFLGPNGAGKSTLIKILTGQLKPSMGHAMIAGEAVWNNAAANRHVGYCPEHDGFWRFLTGREFVFSLARLQGFGVEEASEKTDAVLKTVDMTAHSSKRIGSYSKGMRQRIKLAQALVHDPQILFLDEPLNGMDPVGRRDTIDLIKAMGVAGKTVVVSSHILHEVEEMTETILLINHGRQLAYGTIYDIRDLIDTHPLQVTIVCDEIKELTSRLLEFEDVLSVQLDRDKNQVTIETKRPKEFHDKLQKMVVKQKLTIHSLWSPDEHLEAVFDYLVR